MTISEAAIVLGTSTYAIRQQASEGRLEAREENGLLLVCLEDAPAPTHDEAVTTRQRTPQKRKRLRKRLFALLTLAAVLGLCVSAGMVGYRILESRHKREMASKLRDNDIANRALTHRLEMQRLQSIAMTRQLGEERDKVIRSKENVNQLAQQVTLATSRLQALEEKLVYESTQRQALAEQRGLLIEERDRLSEDLAEMVKHLAVARKQMLETKQEFADAREHLGRSASHPQASPLPREMLEAFNSNASSDGAAVASTAQPPVTHPSLAPIVNDHAPVTKTE